ncbi:heme-binding protein [Chloroflexota bacterium]
MTQPTGPTPHAWRAGNLSYGAALTLGTVKKMLESGEKEAEKLGVPMVIAIADAGGNLLAVHRMDDVMLGSTEIAMDKAYMAVTGKRATGHWKKEFQAGTLLTSFIHQRWVVLGGGYIIEKDGLILGGIGVSGGTIEDHYVARAALEAGGFSTSEVDSYIADMGRSVKQ